ncbi:Thiamine monophosphate synthase [Micromonospora pallida]|uniref:Thiamine monophosphate synthase n=1 Tax=Micromonospora pallida TaxID=145854 RepID=A0A1C6TGC8_9ACTN|nr:Thiamine monophosphate synthase [Micromonospora pallida]
MGAIPTGVVALTDRRLARRPLPEVVAAAVAGGVRWVVLREKDLPRPERAALAAELRAILAEAGGTLVVAGPDPLDGDAVHLPAAGPYPPPDLPLVGRSGHDRAELARLTTEDYVTVSPVHPTRTKPGYGPPLHPEGLADLIRASPVPVLALGGIETPDQVHACVAAGAVGVAVLGALMRAEHPAQAATALTRAFEEAVTTLTRAFAEAATPEPRTRHAEPKISDPGQRPAVATDAVSNAGLRPGVTTAGSSLTAQSGHVRPQPSTATTAPGGQPRPSTATTEGAAQDGRRQ